MKGLSLEKNWFIATDKENIGKAEGWENAVAANAVPAYVPSIIQQFFPDYHGVAYYWCKFTPELDANENEEILLKFGGADYYAEAWLNSEYLGSYEGGETPFSFNVTNELKNGKENLLAVRIINPCDRDIDGFNLMNIPHRNKFVEKKAGSCLNHGGIWYGVNLAVVPKIYIDDKFLTGDINTGEMSVNVTLASCAGAASDVKITVSVYENNRTDLLASKTITANVDDASNEFKLTIKVEGHKLWSVEDPNLYRVDITADSVYGSNTVTSKFGFREFIVKDGFFYLNGKKIFIKSSHSGNAFPVGQMHPVHPDLLRRDFIYAKAAGFNMLRAIAGLFRPEQLDLADEIGLLIYEECYASWCMAFSQWDSWKNKEEYALMQQKHPAYDLSDEKAILDRWIGATEKMILRDRNHPSVVIFGLLNETKDNSIFRTAVDFLPRARELDPTRFIILNSGRFDFDFTIGSASNPYTTEWEATWGVDCYPELFNTKEPHKWASDNHHYARVPINENDVNFFRTFGKDSPKPYFLSEFGVGASFHVIEEWKHFMQYGERHDLEDSAWLKAQSDSFTKDFYRFGLESLFASPEALLKENQRINADERKRVFDILRSNPMLPGYSLTGLLDHGMCGEGLWSYWRRWKPEMFDAVSEGFAPLRFSLFATAAVKRGKPFTVEAALANANVLKDGVYTADFAIISKTAVHYRFTETFNISASDFATVIMKKELTLDLPEGEYELTASLREGSPAAAATKFFVYDNEYLEPMTTEIAYLGLSDESRDLILSYAPNLKKYDGKNANIIIAGRVSADEINILIDAAENGATVLFLERDIFFDTEKLNTVHRVIDDLTMFTENDWLYHKEYALACRDIFGFTNDKLAPLTKFGAVFANQAFLTDKTPDYILCPGFVTGYYKMNGAYASYHAMMGYNFGSGKIYFNSFKLMDNCSHPVAEKMIYNIIGYLSK